MRYHELVEAPLTDFGAHGDLSRPGTLRADDLKAVQNPKWREKLANYFSRTPFNFNIYVYNGGEDGKIHFPHPLPQGIGTNQEVTDLQYLDNFAGAYAPDVFLRTFGFVPPYENAISVMLVENEGSDRLPLTPWIVAHRIAHALNMPARDAWFGHLTDPDIKTGWADVYRFMVKFTNVMMQFLDMDYEGVAALVGKTRAMRSKKLTNIGEFYMEMVTQYIVMGSVTFNYPAELEVKGMTEQSFGEWAYGINKKLERFFKICVGKIFVL